MSNDNWRDRNQWFSSEIEAPKGIACDVIVKCRDGSIFEGSGVVGGLGWELRQNLDWVEVVLWKPFPRGIRNEQRAS